jgi:hypothetical protein
MSGLYKIVVFREPTLSSLAGWSFLKEATPECISQDKSKEIGPG